MTQLHFSNTSGVFFNGWRCCNIDWTPPHERGYLPGVLGYEMGRQTGLDTRHIDVKLGLMAGQTVTYDLADSLLGEYVPLAEYYHCVESKQHFGGVPVTVAGVPLQHISTRANGAALDGHWRGRVGGLIVNLWVWWYPDQPQWCEGRISIVASSPGTPWVRAQIPDDFHLRFGDADVFVAGLQPYDSMPLMMGGDWLADGQPRILPIVLRFHGGDIDLCRAVADQQICMRGLKNLHQDGNPYQPEGFDGKAWADAMRPIVIQRQHDWFSSPLDPAEESRRTGAQGSQALAAAAISHPSTVGVYTIAGLDVSWPMIHLEPDGSPLNWKNHPGLRMVYGRVNRRDNISTDDLGKPFEPDSADSHGQQGPDTEEHWFDWNAWTNARLNGDPCSQWILHSHAVLFLHRFVVDPPANWLTANRGVGWALCVAVELYRNLEDRELAAAIKQRVIDLTPKIIAQFGTSDGWWDWREDYRIGWLPGKARRAMPWQLAVFYYGCDVAGFAFGIPDLWELAVRAADDWLTRAWLQTPDGRWHSRDVIAEDSSQIELNPSTGAPYHDAYLWFGTPFGVATMLRHNEGDARAVAIWQQYLADNPNYEQAAWMPSISKPTVGP